jgi:hypothetical protein
MQLDEKGHFKSATIGQGHFKSATIGQEMFFLEILLKFPHEKNKKISPSKADTVQ